MQSLYLANYDVIKVMVTLRDNLEQSLGTKQLLSTSISIISIPYLCIEITNVENVQVSQLICSILNTVPPVGRAVTRSFLEREVAGSNLGPVKSDTVLPTARHRCDISSKGAVLPGAMTRRWAPSTRYTLWRNPASIMKDLS